MHSCSFRELICLHVNSVGIEADFASCAQLCAQCQAKGPVDGRPFR